MHALAVVAFAGLLVSISFVSSSVNSSSGGTADGKEKWAYVDVRQGAHMFYWLYKSYHKDDYKTRPLVLWLQGGPGGSSCGYGNFDIIGPLDSNLNTRNTTWVREANVLFVDNPVGTGYSYVEDKKLYTTDVAQISADLLTVMKAFFKDNPEFKTIPFYVFGQSYGGKMGAHFSKILFQEIQAKKIDCNLVGYAMGNSWISPVDSTITWGPFIYWMSTTDEPGLESIQKTAMQCQKAVEEERWKAATDLWRLTEIAVMKHTNNVDFYNILNFKVPSKISKLHSDFGILYRKEGELYESDNLDALMNGPIKEKLGIIPPNVRWGAQSDDVFKYQEVDFMKPVVSVVDETLMNTTLQVIVYQGQLDIICDTKAAMDWVQQFKWPGLDSYNKAERKALVEPFTKQTELFVKTHKKFKFYWVLRGGHSAPADAAEASYRMLQRILNNTD